MSLIISAQTSGSSFPPLEAGSYPAVCYGLVDIGWQYNEAYKKSSPKLIIMWEIPGETITIDGEEKSRVISQTYTVSLNEKATLRKDLASWRGRDFTDEELKGFDIKTIVGAPCLLSIVHKESNGRTYANISGVMALPKGIKRPRGTLDEVIFDLDTSDLSEIADLPDWIQKRIFESETYKERAAGIGHEEPGDDTDYEQPGMGDYEEDELELPF